MVFRRIARHLARARRRFVHHARKQISLRQRGPVPGGRSDADASSRRGCERRAALCRLAALLLEGAERRARPISCRPSGSIPMHPVFLLPELRQQSDRLHEPRYGARRPPLAAVSRNGRRTRAGPKSTAAPCRIVGSYCARPRFHGQRHRNDERADLRGAAGRQRRIFCRPCRSSSGSSSCSRAPISARCSRRCGAALPKELRVLSKPELEAFERDFPGRSVVRRADLLDGHDCRVCRRHADFVSDHLHRSLRPAAAIRDIEGHGIRQRLSRARRVSSRRPSRPSRPMFRPGCSAFSFTRSSANWR